jgi:ATP-dependent DNA helicase HFM1/MER3
MVHFLSIHNRPLHLRKTIPVQELFQAPICNLWHSKFDSFNHLQSEVASSIADSNDNIVVSAPTGAGKTALFEIAMARFFLADLQSKGMHHSRSQISNARKIVYISPSKALCEERYDDWSQRFSAMDIGIQCSMITGDMEPGDSFRDIAASQVILTTPEKWDSVTRRWTEHVFLFGSVKLLLVDEVHLLGDETRGGCLESVICRMNTIQRAVQAASDSYCGHLSSR